MSFRRIAMCVAMLALCTGFAVAQDTFVPKYVVNTGASVDFMNHQSSSLSSVLVRVTDIGGRPTYLQSSVEFSALKGPDGRVTTNTMSLRPAGICQTLYQRQYVGVLLCGDAGVLHFDAATLGAFTGQVAVFADVGGWLTKGKHHAYVTPVAREVDITSRQVKPVWAIQIGTAIGN